MGKIKKIVLDIVIIIIICLTIIGLGVSLFYIITQYNDFMYNLTRKFWPILEGVGWGWAIILVIIMILIIFTIAIYLYLINRKYQRKIKKKKGWN